ncbi:MAG: DUF1269 domain-containing protein [Anaerolineae bacterium]|jgi:uncharacterized membrane protein
MPNLVVITFENEDEAAQVLEALEVEERDHDISLDDTAVVVKEQDGTVRVDNEVDRGVKVGAIGGGLLGLLIGLLIGGPIASLVLGAIAGALGGDLANLGIDQRFINNVSDDLAPGSSALFLMVREADPEATAEALAPFKGKVNYTYLPADTEAKLREVLSERE